MGIRERQERDREAVQRAILDAAREMFVSEGYLNVSIRKIAERIEYSPGAIYSYFPSKDDIFLALAEEGFRLLISEAPPPPAEPIDPLEGVRRIFWHYYTFSKRHPEYFALMFLDRWAPRISRAWERFGFVREMRARLAARIQACTDAGIFPPGTNADAVFRILAAAITGPAVMKLCDRLAATEDADALAHDVLEAALAGLRSGIPITFDATECGATLSEIAAPALGPLEGGPHDRRETHPAAGGHATAAVAPEASPEPPAGPIRP
jgi:AcrR family transcriptional regulator